MMIIDYFDPASVKRQLSRVNPSPDSIGSISHYLNFHSRYCDQVMEIWKELMLTSSMDQQVLLLYIVNDLVPISRRKTNCFQEWLIKNLPSIWNQIRNNLNLTILLKVQRLFDAWASRKLFPNEFIAELRTSSNENPFIFILQDVQKSMKSMPEEQKKEYINNMVSNCEDCCKELSTLRDQFGSPRQVSSMLMNIDQNALNQLLRK